MKWLLVTCTLVAPTVTVQPARVCLSAVGWLEWGSPRRSLLVHSAVRCGCRGVSIYAAGETGVESYQTQHQFSRSSSWQHSSNGNFCTVVCV